VVALGISWGRERHKGWKGCWLPWQSSPEDGSLAKPGQCESAPAHHCFQVPLKNLPSVGLLYGMMQKVLVIQHAKSSIFITKHICFFNWR
jgi:hypothetical protein